MKRSFEGDLSGIIRSNNLRGVSYIYILPTILINNDVVVMPCVLYFGRIEWTKNDEGDTYSCEFFAPWG